MSGQSETARYDLTICAVYLYGHDALLQVIDDDSKHSQTFTLDVPSLDLLELEKQLDSVEGLPLASAKEFLAAATFVSQSINRMRRSGETKRNAPKSDSWYETSRANLKARQAARQVTT